MKKAVIFLIFLFLFGAFAATIYLSEAAIHPHRLAIPFEMQQRACGLAARFGYQLSNEQIQSFDGAVLRAWFFGHRGKPHPVILLLHGQADNRCGWLVMLPCF